jgi:outer membrane protein TolC
LTAKVEVVWIVPDNRRLMAVRRILPSSIAVVVLLLGAVGPAHADGALSIRGMTLPDALSFARRESPAVKIETARVALREERAREPEAAWRPRFGATVQVVGSTSNNSATNWLGSHGAVEFPRMSGTGYLQEPSEINWKPYLNTAVGITGEQRLFDFGRIAAEAAAADAEVDVQRARLEDQRLAVDLGVREAFHAVRSAHAILQVARDAVARAQVHRDDARARVTQGLRSRIEQERAEADLARFEVNVLRAEGGLRSAQAAFAVAVGTTAPLLDAIETAETASPPSLPSIEAALGEASRRDPAIKAALLQARAADARVKAADVQTRPEIWAVGTINGAAGGAPRERIHDQTWAYGAVPWIPDWYVGAVFAWRFVDPAVSARTETAKRESEVAAAEVGFVQQERVGLVEQAWVALDVALRTLPTLDRALAAAKANHQQADMRFQSGLGTSVELADAEALRVAAEIDRVQGQFEVARAWARLVRRMGGSS